MAAEIDIYLQKEQMVYIGKLYLNHRQGKTASAFSYATSWLNSPSAFAISPDLPLERQTKTCEGLFLCFQDCSPDRWGRMLLQRQEYTRANQEKRRINTLLSSDYLLAVNDSTRQGALRLSPDNGKHFPAARSPHSVPPLSQLPALLTASDRIETHAEHNEDLTLLVAAGSSLGGARPKASVLGNDGNLYIAKFPSRQDEWDVPLWEYVACRLARRASIRTPDVALYQTGTKHVLLTKRFDRQGPKRIPYLSARTMLQAEDGAHGSYADIAAILEAEGGAPTTDLQELWARMVFNMLIYNVDDHLRNHGFLHQCRAWRLAPVFDLEISHPSRQAAFLHTAIIDENTGFALQDALDAAELFRLKQAEARQRLAELRRAVSFWRQEAVRAGAKADEIRFMSAAFEYI